MQKQSDLATVIEEIQTLQYCDFSEIFLKCLNKQKKLVPFRLAPLQAKMDNIAENLIKNGKPVKMIILKPRQVGDSLYWVGRFFQKYYSNPGWNAEIIGDVKDSAKNLKKMLERFYQYMPPIIKPPLERRNERGIEFTGYYQSRLGVQSAERREKLGISDTLMGALLTEFAFWPTPRLSLDSLMPSMPDNNKDVMFVIDSTAFGYNYFYEMWDAAVRKQSDITPHFISALECEDFRIPGSPKLHNLSDEEKDIIRYNKVDFEIMDFLAWRRHMIENKCGGSIDTFHQNYPITPEQAFIATGNSYFEKPVCAKYYAHTRESSRPVAVGFLEENDKGVTFVQAERGPLKVWEYPNADEAYMIGADVGGAKVVENADRDPDESVAYVGGSESFRILSCLAYRQREDLYARDLALLGRWYNTALIAPERNAQGRAVVLYLKDIYPNLFAMENYEKWSIEVTPYPGWCTNTVTRPRLLANLRQMINENPLAFRNEDFWKQTLTFVQHPGSGKYSAETGCFDDHIFAMGILVQLWNYSNPGKTKKEVDDEQVKKVLLERKYAVHRSDSGELLCRGPLWKEDVVKKNDDDEAADISVDEVNAADIDSETEYAGISSSTRF